MTSKETIQAREAQHHLPSYHHHYYTATPKHSRYNSANDANRSRLMVFAMGLMIFPRISLIGPILYLSVPFPLSWPIFKKISAFPCRSGAGRSSIDTPEIYTVCTPRLSYGPEIGRKHGVPHCMFRTIISFTIT
ncbi:hypothetical protein Y032_0377g273 [Ancylostoma ceylanicum]|uniref:Uncharacterized protein n=1 Tax=Ancylostoma ceylanicum TaxID=53326 RepID=A0A016RU99_9BILA|nr:hypothetical protein Y032_0377g273 [Ancylostoma ceylanicum]